MTTDQQKAKKKYDVAFSFLAQDEPVARDLVDRLAPLNSFIYSRQQEELAGTNALESFRDVFRNQTRVPVVLYRRGWGATPITRVESVAIQEYCAYEGGWDSLIFVTLDSDQNFPTWLHRQHIRFDLQTFPSEQLAGAIKNAVLRAGGTVRLPTAAERAALLAAREQFDQETQQLLTMGGRVFLDAAEALFSELDRQIAEIRDQSGWTIVHGHEQGQFVAFLDCVSMQLLPRALYVNSSRDAYFTIRQFDGRLLTPSEINSRMMLLQDPTELGCGERLNLSRDPGLGWAWSFRGRKLPHAEVARILLTEFLDRRTRAMQKR